MSGKQGSPTKGWEKRGPFSRRPKAGATPASQMPNFREPIDLKLGPVHLIYQNSHWRPESGTASTGGGAEMDAEEMKELRREVAELREKNRRYEEEVFFLDFKVELLTDMLALKTLEVEKLSSSQQGTDD